jgi:hypothetical protein
MLLTPEATSKGGSLTDEKDNEGSMVVGRLLRILWMGILSDLVGLAENFREANMSAKDKRFFSRSEYTAVMVEALRQGAEGAVRIQSPRLTRLQRTRVALIDGDE